MKWTPIALLLLLLFAPVSPQNVKVEIDPDSKQLEIAGWLGDDASFRSNLRITALGPARATQAAKRDSATPAGQAKATQAEKGDAATPTGQPSGQNEASQPEKADSATPAGQDENKVKLNFLPSNLKLEGGIEQIGMDQVTPSGLQEVELGIPTTFEVKITGIKTAGKYTGKIEILPAGQPRDKAETLSLTVVARTRAALTAQAPNDKVSLHLVNVGASGANPGNWLARLLLPAGAFLDRAEIQFEKPPAAVVTVQGVAVSVKGEQSEFQLTQEHLSQVTEQQQAGRTVILPIALKRSAIPPDHYTGNLIVWVAGKDEAIKVPVDLSVRSGPLVPILVLVASIIVGRLAKYMKDRGTAKANALASLNRLENRMRDSNPEDREILDRMTGRIRQMVYGDDSVSEAGPAIKLVEARRQSLNRLRDASQALSGKEQHPKFAEATTSINEARELIRHEKDDEAKEKLEAVQKILEEMAGATATASRPDETLMAAATYLRIATAVTKAAQPRVKKGPNRLIRILASLSGVSDVLRAEATLWVVRPLLWLALLIGLLALGLKTLYVGNPVFGVAPFLDYLGLIFWGLSSDIASRTLSNLQAGGDQQAPPTEPGGSNDEGG